MPRGDRLGEVAHRQAAFDRVADDLREGATPYVLVGSSTGLGVMGYIAGAIELHEQLAALPVEPTAVFVTSLGVTQAGLELGARLLGDAHRVVGIAYQPAPAATAAGWVRQLLGEGARVLGVETPETVDVVSDTRQAGEDYGATTDATLDTIRRVAHSDSLMLDPVYSAKGFTGMLDWIREGRIAQGETVVFVHTGACRRSSRTTTCCGCTRWRPPRRFGSLTSADVAAIVGAPAHRVSRAGSASMGRAPT